MTSQNSPMDQDREPEFAQERQDGVNMDPIAEQQSLWTMMYTLRTVVDELQQSRHQREQGGLDGTIRAPKPECYHGKRNAQTIESWLFNLNTCCNLVSVVGEAAPAEYATTLLGDEVIKWWRQLVFSRPTKVPKTWGMHLHRRYKVHFIPD